MNLYGSDTFFFQASHGVFEPGFNQRRNPGQRSIEAATNEVLFCDTGVVLNPQERIAGSTRVWQASTEGVKLGQGETNILLV